MLPPSSAREMLMQVKRYDNGGTVSAESSVGLARALASGTSQEQYYKNIREYVAKNPNPLAALNAASENGVSMADINSALGTKAATDYFTIDYNTETAPSTNVATGFTSKVAQAFNAPGGLGQTELDTRIKKIGEQYAANTPENAKILRDMFIKEGGSIADLQRAGFDPSRLLGTVAKTPVSPPLPELPQIPIYTPPVVTPQTQTQFPQPTQYTAPTVYQPLPAPPPIYATGQPALDVAFRNSPARTYDPRYGYMYTPAARLLPATGAGMSFTPPSVTSRPRSLLNVDMPIDTGKPYKDLTPEEKANLRLSASQYFAREESIKPRAAASLGRFRSETAPTETVDYTTDPNAIKPIEFRDYALVAKGGLIKKPEGSAQQELTRFANGGPVATGRKPLAATDPLYIQTDAPAPRNPDAAARPIPMSHADLLAQIDRSTASTPSAVTPERDPVKTESRSILDRLKMFTSLDAPKDMSLGETAADIAMGFAPVVGTAQGLRDFERARRDSDNLGMVLSAASMIPVVGGAVKAARTVGKASKAADALPPTESAENLAKFLEGSSLVDESGKPKVFYHGTPNDFDKFDRERSLNARSRSMDTVGNWFSDNPGKGGAEKYGSTIMPVFLKAKNLKEYSNFDDFLRDMHEAEGRDFSKQNPKGGGSAEGLRAKLKGEGYDGLVFPQNNWRELEADEAELAEAVERATEEYRQESRRLRGLGFEMTFKDGKPFQAKIDRLVDALTQKRRELDGISQEWADQSAIVVFDPTQIKSAIGNEGTFDPTNPVITKAQGGYVTRKQDGGTISAPMSNAELLAQMDRIGATPNAVTPERDPVKTESAGMLARLNQAFYENVSKPAVGTLIDMTVGLGDLAQRGTKYVANRAGIETEPFTPVSPRIQEAAGTAGYDPYTIGGVAASILPFARGQQLAGSAANSLRGMFPNLGREIVAYGGGEAGAAAAGAAFPDSTAAELFGSFVGGTAGSVAGAPRTQIDGPRIPGEEVDVPSGNASAMLDELTTIQNNSAGESFKRMIAADTEGAINAYTQLESTKGGKLIDTDLFRELSPEYRNNRTLASNVHEPASELSKLYFTRLLEKTQGQEGTWLFTGGGPASGKSSAVSSAMEDAAQGVVDGTMSNPQKVVRNVNQVLEDPTKNATIFYIDRDPVKAFDLALKRSMDMENALGSGRTIPVKDFLDMHQASRQSIPKIYEQLKDNPRVDFEIWSNNAGVGEQFPTTIDRISTFNYNDSLERILNRLDEAYANGEISETVYRGYKSGAESRTPQGASGTNAQIDSRINKELGKEPLSQSAVDARPDIPPLENSQRTQLGSSTIPSYEKAKELLSNKRILDFGAGRGQGASKIGADTFEPYPREGFVPTYSNVADIPDGSYDGVTSLNVLNVMPREVRDNAVRNIGRVLMQDGEAVITTRGRDVMTANGVDGPEPMSRITTTDTYQKGFTQPELVKYVSSILGDGFTVSNLPQKIGAAGVLVKKMLQTPRSKAADDLAALTATAPLDMSQAARMTGRQVSERVPTSVKFEGDSTNPNLTIGVDVIRQTPDTMRKQADVIAQYPNYPLSAATDPESVFRTMGDQITENLLFLHDKMPADVRQGSMQWYDGANRIASVSATKYGLPIEATAGVYAALSPQMDWYKNVSLGDRVLDIMSTKTDISFTPGMKRKATQLIESPTGGFNAQTAKVVKTLLGKRLSDLDNPVEKAIWLRLYDESHNPREYNIVNPTGDIVGLSKTSKGENAKVGWGSLREIAKAISIFENPAIENISRQLGGQHKVRSFYNNIADPNKGRSVTSDTHNVAAGLLRPLSGTSTEVMDNLGAASSSSLTGAQGTYGLYADAVRNAADERGVQPRQMQSITWEGVRGLYSPALKRNKNAQAQVAQVFNEYKKGKINANQMRNFVFEIGGGMDVPTWYGK